MSGSTDVARPPSTRTRRRVVLLVIALLLLGAAAAWLGLGVRSAARAVQSDASAAQEAISTAKKQLVAGDLAAAKASTQTAERRVDEAEAAAAVLPVRIVGWIPVAGTAVADLDHLIGAAADLASASSGLVDVYAAATGNGSTASLFSGGRADFAVMASTKTSVDQALELATRAQTSLDAVQGTLPGTAPLAEARDSALAEVRPLVTQLSDLSVVLGRLPAVLGQDSTKSYLVVTQNPAELFPGGGAALSAAVIRFADGRMSLPLSGSVSSQLFPGNPRKVWDHVSGAPYFPLARQPAAFAWANIHPDFAKTSVEMQRAWVANGEQPVDGIIVLDPVALEAALKVTGPVRSAQYGSITAGNLVQKLLVEAYADYEGNPDARHRVNDALITSFVTRLSSGDGLLALARALASTAPGGHFRVSVADPELEAVLASTDLGGVMPQATTGDGLAVFTQNQNGSKVDIFQRRAVTHTVTVAADGSAEATTTVSATYETPVDRRPVGERVGYLTPWSSNWYMVYVPRSATDVVIDAPRTDPGDVDDPVVYQDGDGWQIVRARRWTPAGGTTRATVTYRLPAGTFLRDGAPTYSLVTVPQAILRDPTAAITVRGPGVASVTSTLPGAWAATAGEATWTGPLDSASSTVITWS